jgi:hypothetical protein
MRRSRSTRRSGTCRFPFAAAPSPGGLLHGTTVELDVCAEHGTWFDPNEVRIAAFAFARLPQPMSVMQTLSRVTQVHLPTIRMASILMTLSISW